MTGNLNALPSSPNVSELLPVPPEFSMPIGVWWLRAKLHQPTPPVEGSESQVTLVSGFAYSTTKDDTVAQKFHNFFRSIYSTPTGPSQFALPELLLVPAIPDNVLYSAWVDKESRAVFFIRPNKYDLKATDGGNDYLYLGWLTINNNSILKSVDAANIHLPKEPPGSCAEFTFRLCDPVIGLYCRGASEPECTEWISRCQGAKMTMEIKGVGPVDCRFDSQKCRTCAGIHPLPCPFQEYINNNPALPSELESTFLDFSAKKIVLSRPRLVQIITARVTEDKFVLIEAPPCSGKSTLLADIATTVTRRPGVAMWFVRSHQSSDAGVVTNWQSTFQGCLSDLPAEMVNALEVEPNLLEVLKVFHDRDNCDQLSRYEFWLFVDEAQMLYDRAHFWTTLRSFISLNSIKFYVVATGTYGSHTSSASSSSPSELIPRNLRMNLFPSEDNCNSGIAFTKEEFNEFVDLVLRGSHHSMDDDTRDQIVAYASPCPPNPDWERFIHPGVATELTRFVIQIRSRVSPSPTWQKIRRIFREKLLAEPPDSIFTLGRCVPRKPDQDIFPPIMIEVFTKILMQEKILVSPIDETHIPHLVINEKTSCLVTRSSLGKHFPNVLNKLPQKDPISYSNLCPIIGSQQFALTPRERFCHVLLGQVSNSPNPRYRPFSLRDSFDRNPISDFDQAAHDARRMGWLVQAPVTNGKLPLRLPTQWHQEYFTALLRTTPVPEVYYTMAFDDFLEEVIRNMHAKTLIQMFKRENSVRETFYSTQFSSALASLSCETFLISQVPTNNGDGLKEGVVDFACFERDWLVELMRNGSKRADHLHRFTDTGAYHRAWRLWDWRLVDFYFEKEPNEAVFQQPNYRAVLLKRDGECLDGIIKGHNIRVPFVLYP